MINNYTFLENIIEGLLSELSNLDYMNSPYKENYEYYKKEYEYYNYIISATSCAFNTISVLVFVCSMLMCL